MKAVSNITASPAAPVKTPGFKFYGEIQDASFNMMLQSLMTEQPIAGPKERPEADMESSEREEVQAQKPEATFAAPKVENELKPVEKAEAQVSVEAEASSTEPVQPAARPLTNEASEPKAVEDEFVQVVAPKAEVVEEAVVQDAPVMVEGEEAAVDPKQTVVETPEEIVKAETKEVQASAPKVMSSAAAPESDVDTQVAAEKAVKPYDPMKAVEASITKPETVPVTETEVGSLEQAKSFAETVKADAASQKLQAQAQTAVAVDESKPQGYTAQAVETVVKASVDASQKASPEPAKAVNVGTEPAAVQQNQTQTYFTSVMAQVQAPAESSMNWNGTQSDLQQKGQFQQAQAIGSMSDKGAAFASELKAAGKTSFATQMDRIETIEKLVAAAKANFRNGSAKIRLMLNPPQLGTLKLNLAVKDSSVNASIVTETQAARHAILNSLDSLRQSLENQGITVTNFEVTVDQDCQPSFQQQRDYQEGHEAPVSSTMEAGVEATDATAQKARRSMNQLVDIFA